MGLFGIFKKKEQSIENAPIYSTTAAGTRLLVTAPTEQDRKLEKQLQKVDGTLQDYQQIEPKEKTSELKKLNRELARVEYELAILEGRIPPSPTIQQAIIKATSTPSSTTPRVKSYSPNNNELESAVSELQERLQQVRSTKTEQLQSKQYLRQKPSPTKRNSPSKTKIKISAKRKSVKQKV